MIVWKCSRFNCWCDAIVMCREYPQHFRFSFHIQWMVAIIYPHIQCFHTYTHILSQSAARPAYEHVKGQGQATNLHLNNQQRNNLLNKSCTRARLQWTHIYIHNEHYSCKALTLTGLFLLEVSGSRSVTRSFRWVRVGVRQEWWANKELAENDAVQNTKLDNWRRSIKPRLVSPKVTSRLRVQVLLHPTICVFKSWNLNTT